MRLRLLGYMTVWLAFVMPSLSHAQSFSNSNPGTIDNNTFCAGGTGNGVVNDLERTFNITGLSNVSDLNVGLIASHTWRGDMDVRLESPNGTELQLIVPDTSGSGNNDDYNVEISDEFSETINTGSHATLNDTSAAAYEFEVSPNNPLSIFDGEDPNGTWTLKICDDYAGESGNFISAELIFLPPTGADLSLSLSASNLAPEVGEDITLTVTAFSEGPQNSTPTAQVNLPASASFVSATGDGTFNDSTGVWSIGSGFAPGSPRSIDIIFTIPSTGAFTIDAEIRSSNRTDIDSTPNNSSTTEDDDDTVTLGVLPSSTPPALNCPIADQFERNFTAPGTTNGWPTNGTLSRSFTAADPVNGTNIDLDFNLTGDTGFLEQISGIDAPYSQNTYTGGITPAEYSIGIAADFNNTSQFVTMEMDIGTPGVGIGAFQFTIFDVDLGGWVDRLQFRGSLSGNAVTPNITPSAQNFVSGNEAIGQNGNAAPTSSAGNVTVTFNEPVDYVEWDYGNDSSAGPDPDFQIIAMHTIRMYGRHLADINAEKTVEVYDPASEACI